jgi:hypothetical protein
LWLQGDPALRERTLLIAVLVHVRIPLQLHERILEPAATLQQRSVHLQSQRRRLLHIELCRAGLRLERHLLPGWRLVRQQRSVLQRLRTGLSVLSCLVATHDLLVEVHRHAHFAAFPMHRDAGALV